MTNGENITLQSIIYIYLWTLQSAMA